MIRGLSVVGDIAHIELFGRGGVTRDVAVIDAADLHLVTRPNWCKSVSGYAVARDGAEIVFLHRLILPGDGFADHIDGDRMNCRRGNLRLCGPKENTRNAKMKGNRTGFKGVKATPYGRFGARIMVNRTEISLGHFDTPEEAARTYDQAARLHFGEFARPNFPVGTP